MKKHPFYPGFNKKSLLFVPFSLLFPKKTSIMSPGSRCYWRAKSTNWAQAQDHWAQDTRYDGTSI